MDRRTLSRIDEELRSHEVAALCFLCRDVVKSKRLEGVVDAKDLFLRLEEAGVLDNSHFLTQLLQTICRADLLSLLETDSRRSEETDANVFLSDYRVMLYRVYDDVTRDSLGKMKFLLTGKLPKRQIEACTTALDVFAEMEKNQLLSNTRLGELHAVLLEINQELAVRVHNFMQSAPQQYQPRSLPNVSVDYQRVNHMSQLSISETQPSAIVQSVCTDAESLCKPSPLLDESDYYTLDHNPRGFCVIINNEKFLGRELNDRRGTKYDEEALRAVFTRLGFTVVVHSNLTAEAMRREIKELSTQSFSKHDALVVCVLSHGENGTVYGTDEKQVFLRELTLPFTSGQAPTLMGKPKLFFIQACQGSAYQGGALVQNLKVEETDHRLEEDAGRVYGVMVPSDADFLLGMATVPECKSFRNITSGSIYIQQLVKELTRSAESSGDDDILTVLTRVNREVSKGDYLNRKQMPEPKYTLTKKLVLKYV